MPRARCAEAEPPHLAKVRCRISGQALWAELLAESLPDAVVDLQRQNPVPGVNYRELPTSTILSGAVGR